MLSALRTVILKDSGQTYEVLRRYLRLFFSVIFLAYVTVSDLTIYDVSL